MSSTSIATVGPSSKHLIVHTEITPTTRIIVVRSARGTQNRKREIIAITDSARSKLKELPPVLTNGRTSVYFIRRPIPSTELSRQSQILQSKDFEQQVTTPTTISTTGDNSQHISSSTRTEESVTSRSQIHSLPRHRKVSERFESPTLHSPTQSDTGGKQNFFSFSRTKSTDIQANLPSPEITDTGQRTVRNIRRKQFPAPRTKSIVLINPEDQTIAIVENSYLKEETAKPILKRPKSVKKTRFQQDIDSQSTVESIKTSQWYTCLNCLSRHIYVILIICLIFILIGLAGVGVSVYFLATDSQTNVAPKIVGIVIGGVLAITASCFLYCVLGCISCREDDFTSNSDDRASAFIPPLHPNIPRDHSARLTSVWTIPTTQQETIHRQRIVASEISGRTSVKNMTIEMPERLLTGRSLSPKSHKHQLNKILNNIGHVVEDVKKRYPDYHPTKVIVKVEENSQTTI